MAPPSITATIPVSKNGNSSVMSSRQKPFGGNAGAGRVPTKDAVYESKRKVYEQTMDGLSKEIDTLKAKSMELSEKLKLLISGEEGKAQRDELLVSLQRMRKKKDQLSEERNLLAKRLEDILEIVRARGAELDAAREKLPCKRREEIDHKIAELERSIESGVSLSDEKRIVAEISKLHKARRSFDSISSLISAKDQADGQTESTRSSLKKLDAELRTLKEQIKEENDKYTQLLSQKSRSTAAIQSLRKNLDDVRSQIDTKFKERSSAYEAFSLAKEAHKTWAAERQEKYQALLVRREIENEMRELEDELRALSVVKALPELDALEALETLLSGLLVSSKKAEEKPTSGSTLVPRAVEGIDEKKFVVLEKTEDSYFVGKKAATKPTSSRVIGGAPSAAAKGAISSSVSLPHWASLDLEVYGIGAVQSIEDAKKAIDRIAVTKQAIVGTSRAADQEKDEARSQLRAKIESLKTKLADTRDSKLPQ